MPRPWAHRVNRFPITVRPTPHAIPSQLDPAASWIEWPPSLWPPYSAPKQGVRPEVGGALVQVYE